MQGFTQLCFLHSLHVLLKQFATFVQNTCKNMFKLKLKINNIKRCLIFFSVWGKFRWASVNIIYTFILIFKNNTWTRLCFSTIYRNHHKQRYTYSAKLLNPYLFSTPKYVLDIWNPKFKNFFHIIMTGILDIFNCKQ